MFVVPSDLETAYEIAGAQRDLDVFMLLGGAESIEGDEPQPFQFRLGPFAPREFGVPELFHELGNPPRRQLNRRRLFVPACRAKLDAARPHEKTSSSHHKPRREEVVYAHRAPPVRPDEDELPPSGGAASRRVPFLLHSKISRSHVGSRSGATDGRRRQCAGAIRRRVGGSSAAAPGWPAVLRVLHFLDIAA